MSNKFDDKPGAYVDPKTCTFHELQRMLSSDPELYNKCLETMGFAYGFSQIANRATHFDYLFAKGVIPIDYLETPQPSCANTLNRVAHE